MTDKIVCQESSENRAPLAQAKPKGRWPGAQDYLAAKPRPQPIPCLTDKICATLRDMPNWVLWVYRLSVPQGNGEMRWTKTPIRVPAKGTALHNHYYLGDWVEIYGYYAKSSDARTWTTFERATHYLKTLRYNQETNVSPTTGKACYTRVPLHADGVGFMFGVPDAPCGITGVDIDNCRDPQTGELTAFARETIGRLPGSWEVSPSGKGIKGFLRGLAPDGWKRHGGTEIYTQGRFFTVTGQIIDGSALDMPPCDEAIADWHREYSPPDRRYFATRVTPSTRVRPPTDSATVDAAHADAATVHSAAGVAPPGAWKPREGYDGPTWFSGTLPADDGEALDYMVTHSPRFARLASGDLSDVPVLPGQPNVASEADFRLCRYLAAYTHRDVPRMMRLAQMTSLARGKWCEMRRNITWLEYTCRRAVDSVPTHLAAGALAPADAADAPAGTADAPAGAARIVADQLAALGRLDDATLPMPPNITGQSEASWRRAMAAWYKSAGAAVPLAFVDPTKVAPYVACENPWGVLQTRESADGPRGRYLRVSCKTWACAPCRRAIKDRWHGNVTSRFLAATTVHVATIAPAARDTVRRMISRHGGDFIAVELPDGNLRVYASAPITATRRHAGSTSMAPLLAATAASADIEAVHRPRGRPITSSPGWRLPTPPPRDRQWRQVGRCESTVTPESTETLLWRYGVQIDKRWTWRDRGVIGAMEFDLPWRALKSSAHHSAFFTALAVGEYFDLETDVSYFAEQDERREYDSAMSPVLSP